MRGSNQRFPPHSHNLMYFILILTRAVRYTILALTVLKWTISFILPLGMLQRLRIDLFSAANVELAFPDLQGSSGLYLYSHRTIRKNWANTANVNMTLPPNTRFWPEPAWMKPLILQETAHHSLLLCYQPRVNTQNNEVHGVEALVRWRSPTRGILAPSQFIPWAETSGFIVPLGRWILGMVTRQVALWQQQGINLRVAINLSARQLDNDALVDDLIAILAENGMTCCPLDFELTESALCEDNSRASKILSRLQALGAQIHLDDFGTGYSSLARLAVIRFDAIKLDKSLIRNVNNILTLQALLQAILTMAGALQCKLIAEGVETEGENDFLDRIGVDEKQGFLFSRPMPPAQLETWLRTRSPRSSSSDNIRG